MVAVYAIAAVVNVGAGIAALFFVSRILQGIYNALAHPGSTKPSSLYLLLLLSVSFGLLEQLTYKVMSIAERRSFLRYNGELEEVYTYKLANLDAAFFEDQTFNALLARVNSDVNWKPANHAYQSLIVVQAGLRAIVPAILLISFAPWMIPLIVLGSIPSLVAESHLSRIKYNIWQTDTKKATLHYKLSELLRSQKEILEIRLFGIQGFITSQMRELMEGITSKQDLAIKKASLSLIGARIVEVGVSFILQLWILSRVISRIPGFTIGTFTFYSGIIGQLSNAIGLMSNAITEFFELDLFMTDYYQVLDTENKMVDPAQPVRLTKLFSTIEFENVSFQYDGTATPALNDVSFVIKRGDKLAIVGDNGAGKSTIIKLLLRFYYPTSGRILVDGIDTRQIAIADLYTQIGVLFQTFNHYPIDAKANITIGNIAKSLTGEGWRQAANLADASTIIADLPHKEKTMLDISLDNGVDLSGGQWQRVALARAFYRDAELLILDEPTSAVDANAEYEIFENIRQNQANKTTIIISHRFSTVRQAERIIVMRSGSVVESGSHEQLIKQGQLYAQMFNRQAAGYR